ncbi:MAG: S8 family serine peptidase [Flavobacteriaceae bacterium]
MNRFFLNLFLCIGFVIYGQNQKELYHYHVTISNPESLTITKQSNGTFKVENPKNSRETEIFSRYTIYSFQPAFPNTQRENLINVYRVTTDSNVLLGQLQNQQPEKYTSIGEYFPTPNAFYPNDYGTTSPEENLGVPYPMTGLDLINAPGAWGITRGDKKVVIGISDGRIDSTNVDLIGRVSNYLKYFKKTGGTVCYHGTGIASIIGARADNEFGIPGICSDCDLIATGYGRFEYIQELVEAGAKVINTSWALCGFGAYHQNVKERINEWYDEGILIVSSAGNSKKCNTYLRDYASNYAYPASYERVISVTKVFAECGYYEDCIVEDEKYGIIASKLKDRHVSRLRMQKEGSFDNLLPINAQWGAQHNLAVDISAPAETFNMGRPDCGYEDELFVGMTSAAAAFVTGTIGLIWSANYCLASAEVESILKLSSADIENLPGNEPFKMQLGAGRVDAYKAVKMAHEMQLEKGIVDISGRDFYRFDFKLFSSPYQIDISNQTFRDSTTVDFKARKRIQLKQGTTLKPDVNGFVKLAIDPSLPTEECFPKPVKKRPKLERDSVQNQPKFDAPYEIKADNSIKGIRVNPVEGVIDTDYTVTIETDKEVFKETFKITEIAEIPLPEIVNETVTITVITNLYRTQRKMRINRE